MGNISDIPTDIINFILQRCPIQTIAAVYCINSTYLQLPNPIIQDIINIGHLTKHTYKKPYILDYLRTALKHKKYDLAILIHGYLAHKHKHRKITLRSENYLLAAFPIKYVNQYKLPELPPINASTLHLLSLLTPDFMFIKNILCIAFTIGILHHIIIDIAHKDYLTNGIVYSFMIPPDQLIELSIQLLKIKRWTIPILSSIIEQIPGYLWKSYSRQALLYTLLKIASYTSQFDIVRYLVKIAITNSIYWDTAIVANNLIRYSDCLIRQNNIADLQIMIDIINNINSDKILDTYANMIKYAIICHKSDIITYLYTCIRNKLKFFYILLKLS